MVFSARPSFGEVLCRRCFGDGLWCLCKGTCDRHQQTSHVLSTTPWLWPGQNGLTAGDGLRFRLVLPRMRVRLWRSLVLKEMITLWSWTHLSIYNIIIIESSGFAKNFSDKLWSLLDTWFMPKECVLEAEPFTGELDSSQQCEIENEHIMVKGVSWNS